MWYTVGKLVFWDFWKLVIQYVFDFLNFCQFMRGKRGELKKIKNFKIVIDSSVIHRWKPGVLRFLKTCYTICFQFCSFLPIYEGGRGVGEKIQNFKIVIDSSVIHHWKAGVLRFLIIIIYSILFYNMFAFLLIFLSSKHSRQTGRGLWTIHSY